MPGKNQLSLDKEKVLINAIVSIQLGVEDYQLSTMKNGNPSRAISSARNLFAGVLLLFKYKIASLAKTPQQAATLIYKPQKFKPYTTIEGDIEWLPEFEKNNTIDTAGLEGHFESLGIKTDWKAVKELQRCRNDLEHLHPKHPIEEINQFLWNLFPLLREFITNEVGENPATLLGATWEIMLQNHQFYTQNQKNAQTQWREIGVLELTLDMFKTCQCPDCGSSLLEPNREDVQSEIPFHYMEFRYSCIACNYSDSFTELLTQEIFLARENFYDEEPIIIECDSCGHSTFDISEGHCYLCNYQSIIPTCSGCNNTLKSYEVENGVLCERCYETTHYIDEYEPHIR